MGSTGLFQANLYQALDPACSFPRGGTAVAPPPGRLPDRRSESLLLAPVPELALEPQPLCSRLSRSWASVSLVDGGSLARKRPSPKGDRGCVGLCHPLGNAWSLRPQPRKPPACQAPHLALSHPSSPSPLSLPPQPQVLRGRSQEGPVLTKSDTAVFQSQALLKVWPWPGHQPCRSPLPSLVGGLAAGGCCN